MKRGGQAEISARTGLGEVPHHIPSLKFPIKSPASSPACGTGQELQECSDQ